MSGPASSAALLNQAIALHQRGNLVDAEAAYKRVLAGDPNNFDALHMLGIVNAQRGSFAEAEKLLSKAAAIDPRMPQCLHNRGTVLAKLGRFAEAVESYDNAIRLAPAHAPIYADRGHALYELKRYEEALASYAKALTLKPNYAAAWTGRAHVLYTAGQAQDAIAAYRQALKFGGDAEVINFHLAALGAAPSPAAPPQRYVAGLFDSHAGRFDQELFGDLKYRMPEQILQAVSRVAPNGAFDVLDLGCGTGIMGQLLRPMAKSITGIDLSQNMVEKSRERGVYDELVCGDITQFLQQQNKTYGLVVAADVFVYFGDLTPVFREVRRVLREGGLFSFSVEGVDAGDFVLRATLRYAHSDDYLRALAAQCRFVVEAIEPQVVRQERGADVAGYLAIMRGT